MHRATVAGESQHTEDRTRPALIGVAAVAVGLVCVGGALYAVVDALRIEPAAETPAAESPPREVSRTTPRRGLSPASLDVPDASTSAIADDHPHAHTKVTGRVYERSSGRGVPGARITVRPTFGTPRLGGADGDGSIAFVTTADGSFAMKGIPPGDFDVVVEASGYMPSRSSFRKFSAVEDDEGFEFALDGASIIEGQVVDEAGQGVAGARVAALSRSTTMLTDDTTAATSDARGRFVLDPVPHGAVDLFVQHPDYAPTSHAVPAATEPTRSVVIRLAAGWTLVGRVTGPDGPIADARVRPEFLHTEQRGVYFGRQGGGMGAQTDADGRFRLPLPRAGHVSLKATAPGFRPATRRLVLKSGAGAPPEIEFRLQPGLRAEGRVLQANGEPAAMATVLIARQGGEGGQGKTDADGQFSIDGLSDQGPYLVAIEHHRHPTFTAEEDNLSGSLEYQLSPASRILGRVMDASTGKPVTPYAYKLEGPVRMRNQAVSQSGSLEILQLPAGRYTLTVAAEGYQRTTLPELVVTAGIDLTGVEVALRRGATIAGRVTGTRPEGEVLVQALRSTGEQRRFENGALVSDDGTFLIPNLPEGLYTLMAVGPGVRGVATGVAVDLGGLVHDVEVALRPHGAAGR